MIVEEDGEAVEASECELLALHVSLTVEQKLSLQVMVSIAHMVKCATMHHVWKVHILQSDSPI